jgi:hypothetical protein
MSLLTFNDIQSERNIDLTDPNGQVVATSLIAAAIAWVERTIGYMLEAAATTAYFSEGHRDLWLPTSAPVSAVSLFTRNADGTYATVDAGAYDWSDDGQVHSFYLLPSGFKAVKATYTAGWTAETLPSDLRDALIDWVALKLQAVSNFSSSTTTSGDNDDDDSGTTPTGQLKRVTAGDYTEEYTTSESDAIAKAKATQLSRTIGDDVPPSIQEVVARYQRPVAL